MWDPTRRALTSAATLACVLAAGCGAATDIDLGEPPSVAPPAAQAPLTCTTPGSGLHRCGDWTVWRFPEPLVEPCIRFAGSRVENCAALCGRNNLRAADESWSCSWRDPHLTCTVVCSGRK